MGSSLFALHNYVNMPMKIMRGVRNDGLNIFLHGGNIMNVNEITSVNGYYTNQYKTVENDNKKTSDTAKNTKNTKNTSKNEISAETSKDGVIYETTDDIKKATESQRKKIVAQMKKDTETRLAQMQNLVTTMFSKQGIKVTSLEDMWKRLASGDFTADEATINKAKEDISEDGYWGVKETSQRIFDFAVALSGGDEDKMEKMRDAVTKGFKEATKAWGKELPEISQKTYDAVMKKFDDYKTKE